MAYAEDLKFSGGQPPCGFESRPRHHETLNAENQNSEVRGFECEHRGGGACFHAEPL